MSNWQIIQSFDKPLEAHMAKSYLESEGIVAIIQDELTAQVHHFYSTAIGGVKLMVPEEKAELGKEVLHRGGFIVDRDMQKQKVVEVLNKDQVYNKSICPFCKSDNITKKRDPSILVVIVYFILGAIFPIFRPGFHCYDCGKEWRFEKGT